MKLGPLEIILIIAVILIITGASFAPKLGKLLGRGVKKAREGLKADSNSAKPAAPAESENKST